jgi:hypothetical protein
MMLKPRSLFPSIALAGFCVLTVVDGSRAADKTQLLKLRDIVHPAECNLKPGDAAYTGIGRHILGAARKTVLYVVPCRATALNLLDVVFAEEGATLRPVYFANPDFDLPRDKAGREDWAHARMMQIGVTGTVSTPHVDEAAGTIRAVSRIPPGLGQGELSLTYQVRDGAADLMRFAVDLDGKKAITIWQAPKRR